MFARTYSAAPFGMEGLVIRIEAAGYRGRPQIQVTGLAGEVVKESRDRIQACLMQLGYEVPSAKIVVHLSPAQLKKQGSQFDLAVAMGVLGAEKQLPKERLAKTGFLGELSLDGKVHRVKGAIGLVETLEKAESLQNILVSSENEKEIELLGSHKVRLVGNIAEAIDFLEGTLSLPQPKPRSPSSVHHQSKLSLDKIEGQSLAKRALQIALAGRHHLLLMGPPGVGKSLLAQAAPLLLPPLEREELIEVVKAYSQTDHRVIFSRPFRSPHHSISSAALLGGGSGTVLLGEVSLAHRGVLFLDEFPEFRRDAIEGLREPLQNGYIHLNRVGLALSLAARFVLVAAMNPCPCGYALSLSRHCSCSPEKVRLYKKRVSGPILDRIDLFVLMATEKIGGCSRDNLSEEAVRSSITCVIEKQKERYNQLGGHIRNGDVEVEVDSRPFRLEKGDESWFRDRLNKEGLNYRSAHKILKIARTIADLGGREEVSREHLREAWSLRCPDGYMGE